MSIIGIRSSKPPFHRFARKKRTQRLSLGLVLFLAASILSPFLEELQACSNPDGPLKTVVVIIDGIETTATTDGCTLFGVPGPVDPHLFCALAFSHDNNVIQEFLEVQAEELGGASRFSFIKDSSGQIAKGFFPGTTTNPVFAEGFFSTIPQNGIPAADAGKPIRFRLRIRLKRNATFNEIKADLAKPKGMIGLGKAMRDINGNFSVLDNEHKKTTDLGDITALPPPFGAPTLSEWGVIVLALMLLMAGTIFILRGRPLMTGGGVQFAGGITPPLFVPRLFGKVLAGTSALALTGLIVVTWLSGPIKLLDIGGTLLCVLMFAYLVHLLILAAKNSQTNRG